MQTLRKELSREIVKDTEFVVNSIHKIECLLTEDDMEELADQYDEPEDSYEKGIGTGWEGEIVWIDVGKLLDTLKNYFDDCDEDELDSERFETFTDIFKKLSDWKGYTIWV